VRGGGHARLSGRATVATQHLQRLPGTSPLRLGWRANLLWRRRSRHACATMLQLRVRCAAHAHVHTSPCQDSRPTTPPFRGGTEAACAPSAPPAPGCPPPSPRSWQTPQPRPAACRMHRCTARRCVSDVCAWRGLAQQAGSVQPQALYLFLALLCLSAGLLLCLSAGLLLCLSAGLAVPVCWPFAVPVCWPFAVPVCWPLAVPVCWPFAVPVCWSNRESLGQPWHLQV